MGGLETIQQNGAAHEVQLGKKLVNRCGNAFNSSRLILAGGNLDGEVVKSPQLMPALEEATLPFIDAVGQAGFNVTLPKVFEAMLFTNGTSVAEGYIDSIGGIDYGNLPQIGVNLAAEGGISSGTVVRTVFGGTEEMPLRGISYLLPPLIYLEQFHEKGIEPPQLQVIFANNISGKLNGLDQERAADQSVVLASFASAYIAEYFPRLSDAVVFLEDTPLEKGSAARDGLLEVSRKLQSALSSETREALLGKGDNGSKRINPFYGAAHLLIHDTAVPGVLRPLTVEQPETANPEAIISFGGYQEGTFYAVRHEVKPHLDESYNTIPTLQYFTKHRVPPYYMARGGDFSLDDALGGVPYREDAVSKTAQYDLGYLHKVTAARGTIDFADFVAEHRERMAA